MMRFFIFLLLCVPLSLYAEDFSVLAKEAEQNKDKQMQNYLVIANDAKKQAASMTETYKKDIIDMNSKMTLIQESNLNKNKNNPTAMVFVSFSMPEQSIVSILQDAKNYHASVVIRGLIHNSFKDTFVNMATIVKKAGGGGVELNPPAFKKFNIKKVPAVVVLPSSDTCQAEKICPESKFDVVYGDIPLSNALKMIRDHGEVSGRSAEQLIVDMEKSNHV